MTDRKRIEPFSRLKVTVENIAFDFDGMEEDEIAEAKAELPTAGSLDYAADELFESNVLAKDEKGWILNEFELEELVSDRISSDSGFCHSGFDFRYSVSP